MIKVILATAIIFSSGLSWALQGGDESSGTRGGGNIIASEFFDKGIELLKMLEPRSPATANGQVVDTNNLKLIFQDTHLSISEENLYLNGSVVDAINYPKKNLIQINGVTWKDLTKNNRYRLVIHEILGLASIPDTQYKTSQELLNIAYVGINWDRGYRPACKGLKFLDTAKSVRLNAAVRAYLDASKSMSNFSIPGFTCTRGLNLQGFEYTNCDLVSKKPRSEDLQNDLISALEFAGAAKYTRQTGGSEIYEISGIACSTGSYVSCGMNAYWKSGCSSVPKDY